MEVAVGAARWVVGKALGPVADGLLEAWAASKQLGPNIDALKMELLYAQGMLNNTRGREIDNTALNVLLQKLRDLAYNAEDVLDELDYFRIQDQLEGTYEAADQHAKGCVCNLFLNAHHTAKAVGKLLCASPCSRAATHGDPSEPRGEDGRQQVLWCAWPCAKRRSARDNEEADEEVSGCMRKLASGACNTIRDVGKRLHCSSLPLTRDNDDNSGMPVLCGARNNRKVSQKKHVKETPKLEFDRVDLSKRMKHIVEQLQPVCAKVTAILNLELLGSSRMTAPSTAKSPPTTTSDITDSTFYGRDPTKKSIIDSIARNYCDKYLTVLPIVGPGGIGKTTLVQHIYHSQDVQNHFHVKAWVCVSQNFNVNRLTEEIEKAIPSVEGEKKGTSQELIEQRLKSKRLLLILDDIWKCESEDWKRLLVQLGKGQARGNIILVTTRFPAVAEMVKTTDSSINLEGLEHGVFRDLFQAYIFGDEQSKKDHHWLLEIGDKIAEKLRGSPLAAKTVGRLLRSNLDLYHWTRVLESREWEMQTGKHDIMPALKLSYDYLPFHLQQCFSYCALFPEDHRFDSEELIHFWIGLDILHSDVRNKTVEDIGLRSLDALVSHGFFKKDETNGNPHYIIHDLLHDLALKVASHECLSLHRSNMRSVEIRLSIRHLSIMIDGADDSNGMSDENFKSELRKLKTRLKVETLQTLIIFGEHDESFVNIFGDLFEEANALRVLCLPSISYPVEFMLHKFSALLHLRYLRLENFSGRKTHLPSSLSRFYHLRVLHLKALYGFHGDLPRDMSNLAKLCHFLTDYDELHSSIYNVGKLQFLQELMKFQVKKESGGFELEQLGHLMELRELGIYNLEKIQTKEEAAEAKLIDKNHLHRLTLDWESNIEPDLEALVLESLRPNYGLQELRIRGHGGHSCPTWLGSELSLKALKSLHLVGVGWNSLPSFGQMWMLNELKLEDIATLSEFGPSQFGPTTEQTFHNLKRLTLTGLKRLEKLIVGVFSGLQVLVIRHCPELSDFPFLNNAYCAPGKDENIHWLPNLQKLEILYCPKLLSLPPIPYTHTLCSVEISGVGNGLETLSYSDQPFSLIIEGNETLHSLDDTVLAFHNLNELKDLAIRKCPPLAEKHLRMLTLLKNLEIRDSSNVFLPLAKSDVKWQLPIERLTIVNSASGKELTEFLYHLPKLSNLNIWHCEKITRLGVEANQQETTAPISLPAASAVKMEDTQATYQHQQISGEVVEEEVVVELDEKREKEDGMLLLPAHLSDSLQELRIDDCSELSLMASPTLSDGHKRIGGRGGEGEWLQALRALLQLTISAYKASSVSSCCCPFPTSLQYLSLMSVESMETIEPLSNLTSLTKLIIEECGEDLRWEGLWPLHTRGQLSDLRVRGSPNFFVVSDPVRGLQDEQEQQLLPPSPTSFKLRTLWTDDVAGVLVAPVCSLLSSSLTELTFSLSPAEGFTKEQEEALALDLLTSLQELQFWYCEKLQCLPAGLNKLANLKTLEIKSCPALRSLPKDGLPISLQKLEFSSCDKLQCLPAGLNKLANLKKLTIQLCPALRSLPKDGLPNSLQELDVWFCGNEELKQRSRRLMGTIPKIILEIRD